MGKTLFILASDTNMYIITSVTVKSRVFCSVLQQDVLTYPYKLEQMSNELLPHLVFTLNNSLCSGHMSNAHMPWTPSLLLASAIQNVCRKVLWGSIPKYWSTLPGELSQGYAPVPESLALTPCPQYAACSTSHCHELGPGQWHGPAWLSSILRKQSWRAYCCLALLCLWKSWNLVHMLKPLIDWLSCTVNT